ncbi:Uncharacterised protein [Enterobacter cloacae]|nr:Uncharacterised protein [Enterobacter cloacae]
MVATMHTTMRSVVAKILASVTLVLAVIPVRRVMVGMVAVHRILMDFLWIQTTVHR